MENTGPLENNPPPGMGEILANVICEKNIKRGREKGGNVKEKLRKGEERGKKKEEKGKYKKVRNVKEK